MTNIFSESAWGVEEASDSNGDTVFAVGRGPQTIALCATHEDADYVASALNAFEIIEQI